MMPRLLTFVLLVLSRVLTGCQGSEVSTFAGFTFGGGGNTFSADPATFQTQEKTGRLVAGKEGDPVYLELEWASTGEEWTGQTVSIASARVQVKEKVASVTSLKQGTIALQARQGDVCHGSFELTTTSEDGREFAVVGSFTARRQQ